MLFQHKLLLLLIFCIYYCQLFIQHTMYLWINVLLGKHYQNYLNSNFNQYYFDNDLKHFKAIKFRFKLRIIH